MQPPHLVVILAFVILLFVGVAVVDFVVMSHA
jgi:hypothetical protein